MCGRNHNMLSSIVPNPIQSHPISESEMTKTLEIFLLCNRVCEFMAFLYHVEELPH